MGSEVTKIPYVKISYGQWYLIIYFGKYELRRFSMLTVDSCKVSAIQAVVTFEAGHQTQALENE